MTFDDLVDFAGLETLYYFLFHYILRRDVVKNRELLGINLNLEPKLYYKEVELILEKSCDLRFVIN